jgi:hypothetical protein
MTTKRIRLSQNRLISFVLLSFAISAIVITTGCAGVQSSAGTHRGSPPPALAITTSALPSGTTQSAYNASLSASGGKEPYTWSVSAGKLPTGLALSSNAITGTPTQAQVSFFTIQVSDASSPSLVATQQLSISIAPATSAVQITTASLPDGQVGRNYNATLAVSGGLAPYSWSIISGSLPTGLMLTASSGTISGTPTESGTFPITVQVKDSSSPAQTASQGFSIVIAAAVTPVSITVSSLPSGTQNVAYSTALAATGGKTPYAWSITSGSLPTGVTLTASSGLIAGTPTESGTFPITVQVKDSTSPAQTASQSFSIVIAAAVTPLSITTSSLPSGTQNVGYSTALAATGGKTLYTWSITSGSLPTGLSLAASSGTISGTPTQSGTFPITVQVKDSSSTAQTASQAFSIFIAVEGTPDATIPSTFFGMHVAVSSTTSYSTPILSPVVVGAAGKGVVTNWQYLEPSRGVYAWGALDELVSFGTNHNVSVFESNQWEPSWSVSDTSNCFTGAIGILQCPTAPSDLTTSAPCHGVLTGSTTTDCMWKEFLTALVQRYKTTGVQAGCTLGNPQCNGVIQIYEGWNEPGGWSLTTSEFVTLETDFLNTVRANDSRAQVCSPAFIIDPAFPSYAILMNDFFSNGAPKTWDCYDFHINEPTPEAQITDINTFKTVLTNNGIDPSSVTIYATEAGRWGGCGVTISGMTEQAYIGRIELLYWSNGIKRHYWYAYDSCGPLTNQSTTSTLNPAGIGYGNAENWMVGATMSTPCAANGTVWTCSLSRPNGYQALAVWDTAGTITFATPSQYTQYQDLEGGTYSINSNSITIGTEPILLTNGVAP